MYLTAMTHRDELFKLTLRWMNDDFRPGDGEALTRIFVYESAISAVVSERILRLLGGFWDTRLHARRIRFKQELRERIVTHVGLLTPRMEELAADFRRNPKYFFPYLPIDALFITGDDSRLLALGRIKRMARVAEKVSFRLVEALYRQIRTKARHFAELRATQAGVSLDALLSSQEAMQDDFVQAEEAVARSFLDRSVRIDAEALTINDIIGFKIIAPQKTLDRLPDMLGDEAGMHVAEIEKHTGNYNAVNLLLDVALPPMGALTARLAEMDWDVARRRGLDQEEIRRNIAGYVEQGAESVRIELILTTPEELMEAEFGRSIHELRVLRLRQRQEYRGPLGQNAGYLVEYMLALASSPTVNVPELPIKMYGRYLPEEISALKRGLYGTPVDDGLLGAFYLHEEQAEQILP